MNGPSEPVAPEPFASQPGLPPPRFEQLPDPSEFLALLPGDWRDPLEQWMRHHPGEPRFHVLRDDGKLLAGGALFNSVPPEMHAFEAQARDWLERGFGYLGFIWVIPSHRGQGLGSRWLLEMLASGLRAGYWLTVEEEKLVEFYRRCGFRSLGEIPGDSGPEWLLLSIAPDGHQHRR